MVKIMGKDILYLDLPSMNKARERLKHSETYHYDYVPNEQVINFLNGKKYFIRTYGCQANYRDEENISGIFNSLKMVRTNDLKDADIILLNTCAVRENAEDKVYGEIGDVKKLKETKKDIAVNWAGVGLSALGFALSATIGGPIGTASAIGSAVGMAASLTNAIKNTMSRRYFYL